MMKKIRALEYSIVRYCDKSRDYSAIKYEAIALGYLITLVKELGCNAEKIKNDLRNINDEFGSFTMSVEKEGDTIIITSEYSNDKFITSIENAVRDVDILCALYKRLPSYILTYSDLHETVHYIGYDREEDIPTIEHDKSYIEKIIAEKKREARYTVTYKSTLPLARIFGIDVIGMILPPEEDETYYFEGYHSNYNGGLVKDGKIQLLEETRKTHPSGAYMIDIIVDGVRKKRTFFPDDWSPTILCQKVDEACHNTEISIVAADMCGAGVLPTITLDGIVIKTILNKDNTKIVNVYPDEKMFI